MDGLVQHVLRSAGCAYQCLSVGVGASPELCRKSYLALALRLHPDKTDHPQANSPGRCSHSGTTQYV
jgi:curved DNA-binding protein CbpA